MVFKNPPWIFSPPLMNEMFPCYVETPSQAKYLFYSIPSTSTGKGEGKSIDDLIWDGLGE